MELICPYCIKPLEWDTVANYDIGIDYADVQETGHCPKCNRHFHWNSHFIFSRYEDLTED